MTIAEMIIEVLVQAFDGVRLVFRLIGAGFGWIARRVRSMLGRPPVDRFEPMVEVRVRVAEGACGELEDRWRGRRLAPGVGLIRLRKGPGSEMTLSVARVDRLDGDLIGVAVPGAYLELDVPRDRRGWVLDRLRGPEPEAAGPAA